MDNLTDRLDEIVDDAIQRISHEQYELPIATNETLGGVRVGSGISRSEDGTIFVTAQETSSTGEKVNARLLARIAEIVDATITATYDGVDNTSVLTNLSWYSDNSAVNGSKVLHPVGLKQPNAWGLYDMYGNTMERCLDWFSALYYNENCDIAVDPCGPLTGAYRVCRGGSLDHGSDRSRSAARDASPPDGNSYYNGLRLKCAAALSL